MPNSLSSIRGRTYWLTNPFKDDSEDSDNPSFYDPNETVNGIERRLLGHPVMVLHGIKGTTDVAVCIVTIIFYTILLVANHQSQIPVNHPPRP